MQTLNLTEEHTVEKDGKLLVLNLPQYNLSSDKLAKDNEFLKCSRCKNYFDKINNLGPYHPLFQKYGDAEFCDICFDIVNK